jgi:dihydropyrimidinase
VLLNQDIAVSQGKILLLGQNLTSIFAAVQVIDAEGAYVTPGGVDSHVHLHQDNCPTGDTFETGTRSAIAGGTTTVLAFASQSRKDVSLFPIVEDYHSRATGNSYCDYGFHLILTNPTSKIVDEELPILVRDGGITSVKLYMTYEPLQLGDREILDVMESTRRLGMTTMIHAENAEMINWITEKLEARRMTAPYYHAVSRPKIAEDEATYRIISLSELVDIPILIVHMSSKVAVSHVRKAQTRLLPVHAETCPHYLFLTSESLKGEGFEGAKCVCSPPLREDPAELEAMWQGLSNGTFTTFSSDHAPTKLVYTRLISVYRPKETYSNQSCRFDHPQGKKAGLVDGTMSFRKIPNGLPGIETRMATLFCGGVLTGRLTIQKFVELTASNPAKLYGMGDTKGAIAPGYDADFCIWYPTAEQSPGKTMAPFTLTNAMLHHDIDYTPFEGMEFKNWPRYTILRGKVVWDRGNGGLMGKMGDGVYLKRGKSTLSKPREVFVNEFRP